MQLGCETVPRPAASTPTVCMPFVLPHAIAHQSGLELIRHLAEAFARLF
jgi:hypothetical protein